MKTITVARKPLEGTVANNTIKHGCGGLNIDAGRIHTSDNTSRPDGKHNYDAQNSSGSLEHSEGKKWSGGEGFRSGGHSGGRWPANLILQHLDGCRCEGTYKVSSPMRKPTGKAIYATEGSAVEWNANNVRDTTTRGHADEDGNETVANWICAEGCPVKALDEKSGERKTTWIASSHKNNRDGDFMGALKHPGHQGYNDTGGASRFFKQVKP